MLFVGYPLSYETACQLFGAEKDKYGRILTAIVEKAGLKFIDVDKGLCIVGIEIKEIANLWENYTSVDDSIGIIMAYKKKFVELIKESGIDVSELDIQRMEEEEPIRVKNPPPYLITI